MAQAVTLVYCLSTHHVAILASRISKCSGVSHPHPHPHFRYMSPIRASRLYSPSLDTNDIPLLVQNHDIVLTPRTTVINPEDFDDMVAVSTLLYSFHHIIVMAPAVPRLDIGRFYVAVVVDQFGEGTWILSATIPLHLVSPQSFA